MTVIRLPETASTNTYMREHLSDAPHGTVVVTDCQTAGRGQRGNSWEAAPGKNLTFSIILRPHVHAAKQFAVSEAIATAIAGVLRRYIPTSHSVAVKWPNDIYADDLKICGILIENSLTGCHIDRSIAGIGINVNQRLFLSDAPNPVSIISFIDRELPLDNLLDEFCTEILSAISLTDSPDGIAGLHDRYLSMLWRGTGFHTYRLPSGETFNAAIENIAPDGTLTLRRSDGTLRAYAFKEVAAVL